MTSDKRRGSNERESAGAHSSRGPYPRCPCFLVHQSRAAFSPRVAAQLDELERRSGGRLGVAALDVSTGDRIAHRADERFAMCSTFKTLAVGLVLRRTDRGEERLDRRVRFTAGDLVEHSPVTSQGAGNPGMTVEKLCEAAITVSDNTAANLLLTSFGGPSALTAFVQSLGDGVTRLDQLRARPERRGAGQSTRHDVAFGDAQERPTPGAGERTESELSRQIEDMAARERAVSQSVALLWIPGRMACGQQARHGSTRRRPTTSPSHGATTTRR